MSNNIVGVFGITSYLGLSFADYYKSELSFEFINSRCLDWQKLEFSNISTILYVAGIAHVSTDPNMEALYYSVNRDLPIAVAQKAKHEGVKQFIFLSSIIVYGNEPFITTDTKPNPVNFYGKSKLQAEEGLLALADEAFKVTVIRTPMVYGPQCKGNFPSLLNLANKTFVFPDYYNQRSMIYIENLCAFIALCIEKQYFGIVYPQNSEYVSTRDIIAQAAACMGKKIHFTKAFNPLIRMLGKRIDFVNKIFGNKTYDKALSPDMALYNICTFEESIQRSINIKTKD